jgi:hypothetical protein
MASTTCPVVVVRPENTGVFFVNADGVLDDTSTAVMGDIVSGLERH